jgi:hypothetical protein
LVEAALAEPRCFPLKNRPTGFLGDCLSEDDDELRQLIEGVASAGSWAVWMAIFSRSWMGL